MKSISQTSSTISTNRVLTNTYALLGMTVCFSSFVAFCSMVLNLPHPGLIISLIGIYGLLYLVHRNASSALGIVFTFAFTGFLGLTLGPMLNVVLSSAHGEAMLITALSGTGGIFVALSAYTLITKQDFSYLSGFIMVGIVGAFMLSIFGYLFAMPVVMLAASGIFVLISSGMILFHTSEIINGGEKNYILATVSLYIALYNLFVSLLQILMAFSGNNRD